MKKIIGFVLFSILLSWFYGLSIAATGIMAIIWIVFALLFERFRRNGDQEKRRFSELSMYMEQLLYTFQRKHKILASLKDISAFFPEGNLHEIILQMLEQMEQGEGGNESYRLANELIEQAYPCKRLSRMNRFMEHVESYGGEMELGIKGLQTDLDLFIKRTEVLQGEKRAIKVRIGIAIVISLLICGVGVHFLPQEFGIGSLMISQVASLILVMVNLSIYLLVVKKLLTSWLIREDDRTKSFLLRDYQKVNAAVPGKETIGYKIAYTRSRKAIIQEFPSWVLEVSLYLDRGNAQMALKKSTEQAHPILKEAVTNLLERLSVEPGKVQPFLDFLKPYQLLFVQSVMKTLYGISEVGSVNGTAQIALLLERNQQLADQSEVEYNKNAVAGIGLFSFFPMLMGSMKLMLDMVIFIFAFLKNMNWRV